MSNRDQLDKIYDLFPQGVIRENVDLKDYGSFKISSIAKFFVDVHEVEDIIRAIDFANSHDIKYFVLGNGSNILFEHSVYDGIIIHLGEHFARHSVEGNEIYCQAGMLLADASKFALEHSLGGLEFACGIPGSIGGAVFMNAGAYGGEMKHVLKSVRVLTEDLKVLECPCQPDDFSYRNSFVQQQGHIVLSATISLQKGDACEIKALMDDLTEKRVQKQPLEYPSVGSAFKRPEGYFAGKLIEDSGLRGFCIGDACVSEKHCGFIINKGNATSEDVVKLVHHIQNTVFEKFGVKMEREFKII